MHVASPVSNLLNFNSVSIPIDARVNRKLKTKIWVNEFIEFGSLLKRGISEPSYHIAVSSSSVSQSNPTLSLEPITKSRPISNVENWTIAFQIFVGIYTSSKSLLDATSLMKYGEVVRDLASPRGDWRFYDTQFRCLMHNFAVLHTGNSGLRPKILETPNPKFHKGNLLGLHHWVFLRASATNFIRLWIAMAASINIHVTNVTCHIQLIAVIFYPHRPPLLKAPLPGPELPTPVQIERLFPLLHGYDVELVHALDNGLKFGFPIHPQGPRASFHAKNLASAYEHPQIVSVKIFKELGANRLAGPCI